MSDNRTILHIRKGDYQFKVFATDGRDRTYVEVFRFAEDPEGYYYWRRVDPGAEGAVFRLLADPEVEVVKCAGIKSNLEHNLQALTSHGYRVTTSMYSGGCEVGAHMPGKGSTSSWCHDNFDSAIAELVDKLIP